MKQILGQFGGFILAGVMTLMLIAIIQGGLLSGLGKETAKVIDQSKIEENNKVVSMEKSTLQISLKKAPKKDTWYQVKDLFLAKEKDKIVGFKILKIISQSSTQDATLDQQVLVDANNQRIKFVQNGDYQVIVRGDTSSRLIQTFFIHI